jgi:hypothetical protein
MKNTKKISLPSELSKDAAIYASALDEIGGKKQPGLAEILIEDPEEPLAIKALKTLSPTKREETLWITGWFRGVADARGCEALAILRAGRLIKLDEAA